MKTDTSSVQQLLDVEGQVHEAFGPQIVFQLDHQSSEHTPANPRELAVAAQRPNNQPHDDRTIMVVESKSRPGVTYQIRQGRDDRIYCTCPSWKFSKGKNKTCKHMKAVAPHYVYDRSQPVS